MYHVTIDGRVVYETNDYRTAKRQVERVRRAYLFLEVLLDYDQLLCD